MMSVDAVAWLLVSMYFQLVQLGSRYAEFSLELIYALVVPRLLKFPITQPLLSGCFQIALENDFQLGWLFPYVSYWYVPLNQGSSLPEDSTFSNPSFGMLTLRYEHFEKSMEKKQLMHYESNNSIKNWLTWAHSVIATLFVIAITILATMICR